MKEKLIILILLITHCSIGQSLSGYADYNKKSIVNDSLLKNNDDIDPEIVRTIQKASNNLEKTNYRLYFNDLIGKYEKIKSLSSDSESKLSINMSKLLSGFIGNSAFYSKKDRIIIITEEIYGEKILIKTSFDSLNWKLTNDTKIISNLTCYKAKTKKSVEGRSGKKVIEIIAWYAPEINLPYGPDGYGGLPGLIVQLQKENIITFLKKIEFQDEMMKLKLPNKGRVMTETEFNALMKDAVINRRKHYRKN
ncbi:GLPGLI family protein [Subsaximicrobium wynnwilliamsii]|uniref:GLPGLI family protein n=1 Tax=Subsaximicrobium wynnwilliamsii TaxID=291179 RepID=A0A5C6ZHN3_9FLAO|nr:GLPGLI family protein [Subsaximicrobium wynnwilliamsii]TXD83898.1 GLPGLI family protein [Subsaximicrobium wynnwilliamsii]TXD89638.1 GLPGLI family protein [Subsaximicrobium wynnwilliamsii]TXE02570.1 GLPGLI family protein [Subsaximicrobium wynnwilliamsii]